MMPIRIRPRPEPEVGPTKAAVGGSIDEGGGEGCGGDGGVLHTGVPKGHS